MPLLISCAPGGTGKLPIGPLTLTVLLAGAGLDAGLAVVVTLHAASDIAAAQAVVNVEQLERQVLSPRHLREEVREAHRIGPARNRDEHAPPGSQEAVLALEADELGPDPGGEFLLPHQPLM